MVGCAAFYIIAARPSDGLPPVALASGGLLIGAVALALVGATGLLPVTVSFADVALFGAATPWWVPLLVVGVIATAVAYASSITAAELLGSRLASFTGLLEVVAATLYAWLLLGERLGALQLRRRAAHPRRYRAGARRPRGGDAARAASRAERAARERPSARLTGSAPAGRRRRPTDDPLQRREPCELGRAGHPARRPWRARIPCLAVHLRPGGDLRCREVRPAPGSGRSRDSGPCTSSATSAPTPSRSPGSALA
ncbi:DMT family transporter [Leifsonia sp. L25]|uniref:DMT family transporter n=1 Tax=Leifsonia sp. L25 TaxID=3423957 RepID=UPI003D682155